MKKLLLLSLLYPFALISQVQIGQDIDGVLENAGNGYSVSLSSDGTILAIGEPFNYQNATAQGSVRLYANQSGVWTQIGSDIYGEGTEAVSGSTISLSSDGSIVAIGALLDKAVRIYENQSGVWTQIGATIDFSSDIGGTSSVSLSSDGTILAIGKSESGFVPSRTGFVSIFKYQSGTWSQIGSDIFGEAVDDWFGRSVSLNSDGTVVAIGASMVDSNGTGYVRVYENQSDNWIQLGQDIDGETAGDQSGKSVSLSSDGNIVAIGAPRNDGNGLESGHVRVYENQSGTWNQIGTDIEGEATGDLFGFYIDLSSDASIIAIGAILNDGNGSESGHVRIYENQSGTWNQIGTDIDGEATGDWSGYSVSLSSNGSAVAIGAVNNDGSSALGSGHARVYDLSALLSSDEFVLSQFSIYPNPAKEKVTIDLKAGLELQEILIYNNLGQQIMMSKKLVVDTSSLNSGLYYLQIKTDKGNGTKKLIIE